MENHPNVLAVKAALPPASTSRMTFFGEGVHTAAAAAAALGIEVGQIANSLIFNAAGEPLLILTSGAHRVDTKKVAAELGLEKLGRATPDFVRTHTSQAIGGVAPLGHPKPIRTLVDTALASYEEIWAAGGVPQAVFPITYAELLRITAGTATVVA
ncbi:YbaK/EbsC family protein [Winogradskya humida]|uniref:YbaK/aminoacyl-tRNA synthetase-associated domain-containing protein n=1 Tax=Winogradskya humida TaxID=113566 RepID=A0ABQ3ZFV4_9ACTN|nr:YbaK/EbsC family protein [Actinoplanes humidus]GIE17460.1 hypothetical protein Ahu01nite_005620 [Actinoplanes humidus]